MKTDDEQWRDSLPVLVQPLIGSRFRLGDQISSVRLPSRRWEALLTDLQASWQIFYTDFSRLRQCAALVSKNLWRIGSSLKRLLLLPSIILCLPVVRGSPIRSPDEVDEPPSIKQSVPLLVGSLYVAFAAAILATAHSLATQKGPIRVWGCMMGISAYGWWAVRNDAITSPSLSIT